MMILGIESAALVASVALLLDDAILAEYTLNHKKTHSQTLMPMIEAMAIELDMDLSQVDAIAISGGPGSFTGLRIGAATAKGLGLSWDKPLIHVPTLEALAFQFYGSSQLICPIMDARRDQVYTGIYRLTQDAGQGPEAVLKQTAISVEELLKELNEKDSPVIFTGDAIPVHRTTIEQTLAVPFSFAPAHLSRQRAAAVAALAAVYYRQGRLTSADDIVPEYLRLSQAERLRAEAEKAIHSSENPSSENPSLEGNC